MGNGAIGIDAGSFPSPFVVKGDCSGIVFGIGSAIGVNGNNPLSFLVVDVLGTVTPGINDLGLIACCVVGVGGGGVSGVVGVVGVEAFGVSVEQDLSFAVVLPLADGIFESVGCGNLTGFGSPIAVGLTCSRVMVCSLNNC
jgi:hypothetical protein